MIAKCIDEECTNLTFGKEYEVIKKRKEKSYMKPYEDYWVYLVIDDTENKSVEPCCLFKEIK